MAWLIYALGGGWGHMQRGLALARRAAVRGVPVSLLTNCRQQGQLHSPAAERWTRGVELLGIDPNLSKSETIKLVRAAIDSRSWQAVVVDTFPRGLTGELAEIIPKVAALRVWVHRDLSPEYVAWANLRDFARHFDLVLLPGENAPLADLPQALRTEPWLLCDEYELLDRARARARLGIAAEDTRPVVLVSAAGMPEDAPQFARLAAQLRTELNTTAHVLLADGTHWPLLELLRGVDLLIGGGGYHTVHEARAAGVPLLALPQPRLYDRQDLRLSPEERVPDPAALPSLVRARLIAPRRIPAAWPRGAAQGVEAILRAVS